MSRPLKLQLLLCAIVEIITRFFKNKKTSCRDDEMFLYSENYLTKIFYIDFKDR